MSRLQSLTRGLLDKKSLMLVFKFIAACAASKVFYSQAATTVMKRILKAACESGTVKKFVHTGAIGVFFNMDFSNVLTNVTFDENTWSSVEEGDVDPTTMQPFNTYVGAKIISEKLMWRAAEQYPHMDCTSILTTCVYGRFLPNYPAPQKEDDFNGNKFIYQFIKTKDRYFPPVPMTAVIHNRDNARAHVRSLAAPPLPKGEKKRLITTAGYMPWDEAVEYIKEKRPELKDRLPDMSKITLPAEHFVLDNKLTEKVLGMKSSDMIQWREILLESLDFLLEWEKGVKEGHNGEA